VLVLIGDGAEHRLYGTRGTFMKILWSLYDFLGNKSVKSDVENHEKGEKTDELHDNFRTRNSDGDDAAHAHCPPRSLRCMAARIQGREKALAHELGRGHRRTRQTEASLPLECLAAGIDPSSTEPSYRVSCPFGWDTSKQAVALPIGIARGQ
jgi:hypothetical protein